MAQVRKRHADVATGLHSKRTHAARHQAWHLTSRTLFRSHRSITGLAKRSLTKRIGSGEAAGGLGRNAP